MYISVSCSHHGGAETLLTWELKTTTLSLDGVMVGFMEFSATFNNILAIS
jgi:hypothetical protein